MVNTKMHKSFPNIRGHTVSGTAIRHKTLEWTLPLYEVYNTEINRPRVENEALPFHYQQLNAQVHAVQQENEQKIEKIKKWQRFYNSKKQFWQLSKSARNEKRQKNQEIGNSISTCSG